MKESSSTPAPGVLASLILAASVVSASSEPPGRPAAPSVVAVADTTDSVDLTWSAPSNNGPPITHYTLRWRVGGGTGWTYSGIRFKSPETGTTILGLDPDTLVEVQVTANNSVGSGAWSPTGSGRTNATTPSAEAADDADDHDGGGGGGGGGGGAPPPDDEEDGDSGGGTGGGGTGGGPPRAAITTDAECEVALCRVLTGVPVSFRDNSSGSVRAPRWDFGDGKQSRSGRLNHAWSSPGFYEVTLTVSGGPDGTVESIASLTFLVEPASSAGMCVADEQTRCLRDSRYAVTADWWTAAEGADVSQGAVVSVGTDDSGMFQFFGANNWEVLIKVLDGCSVNGHVWVFGASTTDLGYLVRVTDTSTGAVKEYRNEPGMPAPAITDVTAFPDGCEL